MSLNQLTVMCQFKRTHGQNALHGGPALINLNRADQRHKLNRAETYHY